MSNFLPLRPCPCCCGEGEHLGDCCLWDDCPTEAEALEAGWADDGKVNARIAALEAEVARLKEIAAGADDGGHWYSQVTMDAVVKERDDALAALSLCQKHLARYGLVVVLEEDGRRVLAVRKEES